MYTPSDPLSQFVFKGIDFRTFWNSYQSGHIRKEVKIYYQLVELVSNMPRHLNVMASAQTLVTICKPGDDRPFVCGSLYPFLPNGNLAGHIEKNNESSERIPLSCKAQSHDNNSIVVVPGVWMDHTVERFKNTCSWFKLIVASMPTDTRVFMFSYNLEIDGSSLWHQLLSQSIALIRGLDRSREQPGVCRPLPVIVSQYRMA